MPAFDRMFDDVPVCDCPRGVRGDRMLHAINEFRRHHNRDAIRELNHEMSEYCHRHCWAMIHAGGLYHAEPCYTEGWSEAVATCYQYTDWRTVEYILVFDVLGSSQQHCDILLNSNEIAYGVVAFHGMVYLTVRGR